MRKTALFLAVILIVSVLISCGVSDTNENEDGLYVIATIFPQYDFARAIVGERGSVEMLLAPEVESHTYEPSMADIAKIDSADLFIYTGGGIDTWAESITADLDGGTTKSIAISSYVSELCPAEHDHEHDTTEDEDGEGAESCVFDEHVWTSPKNAVSIFEGILSEICRLDPENEEYYKNNAEAYLSELYALDADFEKLTSESKKNEIVFADRFPFLYLTNEYGIEYHAALSGCSIGAEPSAAVIAELIGIVNDEDIGYVFVIENSSRKTAELISEATGCEILLLHSCHNVSAEELLRGETYLSLMRNNLENLKKALG